MRDSNAEFQFLDFARPTADSPPPRQVSSDSLPHVSNRRASDGDAIDRAPSVGMRNGLIGGCLLWALLLWGLAWLAS